VSVLSINIQMADKHTQKNQISILDRI